MNKDDILIIMYPFWMKNNQLSSMYENILKQRANGLILLPDYCKVVTAPKDVEIKTEMENDDSPSLWLLVDNPNYSPFDHSSRPVSLKCNVCHRRIDKWDDDYLRCPYCGKKHTFVAEEKKEYTNEELAEAFDNGRGG
jgi:DNA-directed RNA polymerase subunit RPC12/RpoP